MSPSSFPVNPVITKAQQPIAQVHSSNRSMWKTCWLLGNILYLQLGLSTATSVQTTLTLNENQLCSNQVMHTLVDSDSTPQPDVVFVCLPGIVNKSGSRRDHKIQKNIISILQHMYNRGVDVMIIANERSPAWNLTHIQTFQQNTGLYSVTVPWCLFDLKHEGIHIQRSDRLVTNCCVPDMFIQFSCSHNQHTTIKPVPSKIQADFVRSLWTMMFDNQGHGGRAESSVSGIHDRNRKNKVAEYSKSANAADLQECTEHDKGANAADLKDSQTHVHQVFISKRSHHKKAKPKIPVEDHHDDCGENTDPIHLQDDDEVQQIHCVNVVFEQDDAVTEVCSISSRDDDTTKVNTHTHETTYFSSFQQALSSFQVTSSSNQFRHDVCQLFGGKGTIIQLAVGNGLKGSNWDAVVGFDLSKSSDTHMFWHYMRKYKPSIVVASPPCTPFGPWSRLNKVVARKAWTSSFRKAYPLALLTAQVCMHQLKHGRDFICENPLTSDLWKLRAWQTVLKHPKVVSSRCHQCMYGLVDGQGQSSYKPTRFVASNEMLLKSLRRTCDHSHTHGQLAGNINGRSKCRTAQTWPLSLCRSILRGILDLLSVKFHRYQRHVYGVDKHDIPLERDSTTGTASAPSVCPGCRAHARRDDPRHNRHPTVCRFSHVTAVTWNCQACVHHKHSRHTEHSFQEGDCQWANSRTRQSSSRQVMKKTITSIEGEGEEQEKDETTKQAPPSTPVGSWTKVVNADIIVQLRDVMSHDGWFIVQNNPALVVTHAHNLRTPEPRFDSKLYKFRSTFGYFPELGGWFVLEVNELWAQENRARRAFGYPVPLMVCVFCKTDDVFISLDQSSISKSTHSTDRAREDAQRIPAEPVERMTDQQEPSVPFQPATPVGEDEEPDVPVIVDDNQTEPSSPPDWSDWQLSRQLGKLKTANRSERIKVLRTLHVRFWHASVAKMQAILKHAGVEKTIVDLVPSIVITCKICRQWQRPDNRPATNTRVSTDFNSALQVDLLFVSNHIILHAIDEATRWSTAIVLPDRQSNSIIRALNDNWFRIYGPPDLIVSDQEGGLCSEEASIWAERWGTNFRFKPKGSHASVVERHHSLLRDIIHRIQSQCITDRITVELADIVAEATFAKNSLTFINGISPYMAVLGRQPRILADIEGTGLSMLRDDCNPIKHSIKVREFAIQSVIEATTQDRLKRALHHHARPPAESLQLEVNELVDIYRTPANKDLSGWRGPCRVVNLTGVHDGYIDVKWGGRVMSVRTADIRKHAYFLHTYFQMTAEAHVWTIIKQFIRTLQQTSKLFGWVSGKQGIMLSVAAREHPEVHQALLRLGLEFPLLDHCTGGRVGVGIKSATGIHADNSILIWYLPQYADEPNMMTLKATQSLNFQRLFGADWLNFHWIQLYGQSEDINRDVPVPIQSNSHPRPVSSISSMSTVPMSSAHFPPPSPHMSIGSNEQPMSHHSGHSTIPVVSMQSDRSTIPVPVQSSIAVPSISSSSSMSLSGQNQIKSVSSRSRSRDYGQPTSSSASSRSQMLPIQSEASSWSRSRTRDYNRSIPTSSDATISYPEVMPHDIPVPTDQHSLGSLPSTIPYDSQSEDEVDNADVHFGELKYLLTTSEDTGILTSVVPPHIPAWWNHQDATVQVAAAHKYFSEELTDTSLASYEPAVQWEFSSGMAQWLNDPLFIGKDEVAVFTVHNAQKTTVGVEKTYDALTEAEIKTHWNLCEQAIKKELKSFADLDVFYPLARSKTSNVLTSRWVLRWKSIDNQRTVKARLTARGFQDLAADSIETYAGTASRWGQKLVVSVAAQHSWELFTWDVSTAFLQGVTFEELAQLTGEPLRQVAITVPKGSEKYFRSIPSLKNIDFSKEVLGMSKAVYGLKDAPRAWRIKLDKTLRELGGKPLSSDGALYVWHNSSGQLQLILSTHVDDKKGAGTDECRNRVKQGLEKAFGTLKEQTKNFEHCGILHEQTSEGIYLHQQHYVKQLHNLSVHEIKGLEPTTRLTEQQQKMFSSVLGGLSWLIQTRLDIAIYVCALQRASKQATVEHYIRLNKVVKWVKKVPSGIWYKKLTGKTKILVISDSAFKREDATGLAMRGAIIAIASKEDHHPGGLLHIIEFYARKQRRVTRSTYAAELQALADSIEVGRLIALAATEINRANITATQLYQLEGQGKLALSVEACIDAKSVYDSLRMPETKAPAEQSLIMVLLSIKEMLKAHILKKLWWIHTEDMLADGLNKGSISRNALLHAAHTGEWKLLKTTAQHEEKVHVPIT